MIDSHTFSRDTSSKEPSNPESTADAAGECIFGEIRNIIEPKPNEAEKLSVGVSNSDGSINWIFPAGSINRASFLSLNRFDLHEGGLPVISTEDRFLPVLAAIPNDNEKGEFKVSFDVHAPYRDQPEFSVYQKPETRTDLFTLIWTEFDLQDLWEDRGIKDLLAARPIRASVNIFLEIKDGPIMNVGAEHYNIIG